MPINTATSINTCNPFKKIKDTINGWLHHKPSTQDTVDDAVDRIRRSADELTMAVAQEVAAEAQLEIKLQQTEQAATSWHDKALNSMKKNDEPAARIALENERDIRSQAQSMKTQVEQAKARIEKDKEELRRVQNQATDAANRGDDIKNRDNVDQAKDKANGDLDPTDPNSAAGKLDQAGKDTDAKEQADKAKDDQSGKSSQDQLDEIQRKQEVEDMLERLRREANGGAPAAPAAPKAPAAQPAPAARAAAEEWHIAG